ncbi:MAG: DegT/DnrJ/EryC1/StrS family aminotransferase [Pirellulaceae bacterium]
MLDRSPALGNVPFFRVALNNSEINEVIECLRSGWLTTGPRVQEFEMRFADSIGAKHAVALNSGTAALHLAVEALGLEPNQGVLVPTMTFAATAEVVRYQGAIPILVDCDPLTLNMDLEDAERKLADVRAGRTPLDKNLKVVGMIPVHVGGLMMDVSAIERFAVKHDLWVVEDAAHAFPASFRARADRAWRKCGQHTAHVTCYSFYANKTITTGEGGMAVTDNLQLADRMKCMSLHGLSRDAWDRYSGNGSWDYAIIAPGYKYNMTDIAAGLGIRQLARAEAMRTERESTADFYRQQLADIPQLELPIEPVDRIHAWHLFPIRLNLASLSIDRNEFLNVLRRQGVGWSVHWRPLHLHPYYQEKFGWLPEQLPVASREWTRLISLPLFPGMRDDEKKHVVQVVTDMCQEFAVEQRDEVASPRSMPAQPISAAMSRMPAVTGGQEELSKHRFEQFEYVGTDGQK